MKRLTQKELDSLSQLMEAEALASKKANLYANTLTDTMLAERLARVAHEHEKRFQTLMGLMGGKA